MRLPTTERIEQVRRLAREGTPKQKARARMYLNILLPVMQRKGRR